MAFSPEVHRDGLGFCGATVFDYSTGHITGVSFHATHDAGRSWQKREAAGLLVDDQDALLGQIIVAPDFVDSHAIFVQTSKGLFRSNDEGEIFELMDPLAPADLSGDRLTPYIEATPGAIGPPDVAFAWANESMPARIAPPFHIPVAGSPFDEGIFLIPPKVDAVTEETYAFATQVVSSVSTSTATTALFACVYPFNCAQMLFRFPDNLYFVRAWVAPDFRKSQTMYVSLKTWLNSAHKQLWRSTDGGRSFSRWTSVNRILARARNYDSFDTKIALALHERFPRRIFLHVSHQYGERIPVSPPAHQLFRSEDKGKTWKRVAFGRFFDQRGLRGTMWNDYNLGGPHLELLRDGRLMAIGKNIGRDLYQGPYCSLDNGKSWSRLCH